MKFFEEMKGSSKKPAIRARHGFFFLLLYYLIVFSGFGQKYLVDTVPEVKNHVGLVVLFTFLPIAILGILFYGEQLAASFSAFWDKEKRKRNIVIVVIAYCISILLVTISSYIFGIDTSANQETLYKIFNRSNFLTTLLAIGILGPFVEELAFRQVIITELSSISQTYRKPLVYILSILSLILFTYVHLSVISEAALYLPIAMVVVSLYVYTKESIAHVIFFHMLNNSMSTIILYLAGLIK